MGETLQRMTAREFIALCPNTRKLITDVELQEMRHRLQLLQMGTKQTQKRISR